MEYILWAANGVTLITLWIVLYAYCADYKDLTEKLNISNTCNQKLRNILIINSCPGLLHGCKKDILKCTKCWEDWILVNFETDHITKSVGGTCQKKL